jgi:hypothetical protein
LFVCFFVCCSGQQLQHQLPLLQIVISNIHLEIHYDIQYLSKWSGVIRYLFRLSH